MCTCICLEDSISRKCTLGSGRDSKWFDLLLYLYIVFMPWHTSEGIPCRYINNYNTILAISKIDAIDIQVYELL